MTLKHNLFSIWHNLTEPECSSQKTEIGAQVLNKLLLGTSAGNSSWSSSPWNFSCHLLLLQCTSFNHCKDFQLRLGVLFFLVILTGKILKKAGHGTRGTQTTPVLPEGWDQAMLQSRSQMFRWHLARKKLEKGVGQPGCPSSPQFTQCMAQDSWSTSAFPRQHQELRDCSQAPSLPGWKGTTALLEHRDTHQSLGTDLLAETTQRGLLQVQGNTGYIPKLYCYQAMRQEESYTLNFDFFILQRAKSSR